MLPRLVSRRPFHRRVPFPSNSTPRPCHGRARIGGTCTWPLMPACCGGDGHAVPRAKGREGIGRARDMEEADLPRATHMHDATTLVPGDPGAACTTARAPLDSPARHRWWWKRPGTPVCRPPRAHGRRGATEPTIGREVRCIRPCFIRRVRII